MSDVKVRRAERPEPDALLVELADYVTQARIDSDEAYRTARYCLMDTLACGMLALEYPACTKLLGPVVPGADMPAGARVPGTRSLLYTSDAADRPLRCCLGGGSILHINI